MGPCISTRYDPDRVQKAGPMNRAIVTQLILSLAVFVSLTQGQEANERQVSLDATYPEKANAVYRVTGRVVDDVAGSPLSGVTVRLQIVVVHASCATCNPPLPPPPEAPPPREIVTGDDGRFAFDNVQASNVSITAKKVGYFDVWQFRRRADDPMGLFLVGKHTRPIVIRLAPTASISGVLRDHNGTLIRKNQIISLWRLGTWDGWPRLDYGAFATFDANGTYRFDNLGPGRYYLVAEPPVGHEEPAHDEAGHAVGETPMRYPAASEPEPNPFFTLHEGEQAHIDFRFPLKTLHRVAGVVEEDQSYSYSIEDADRANAYLVTGSPFEKKLEAWLPKGTFWLSTARDDVSGSMPFEVAESDVSNLQFSIGDSGRIEIPVEIYTAPGDTAGAPLETPRGLWFLRMVRILPRRYVEVVGESTNTQNMEGVPPRRVESVSVVPGDYTVEVAVWGNFYAKSVVSGPTDLAFEFLTIRPGGAPVPIQIVLATAAKATGVVERNGELARAWVYAVAEEIESKTDFRVFSPVSSDNDGMFHMEGLAPGTYLFFASDVELPLNVHDPDQIAYWRSRGKTVRVEAGKTSNVLLTAAEPPPE